MSAVEAAQRLVGFRSVHPVVSVYLDLDPESFAIPSARVSEIDSLLDGAHKRLQADEPSEHDERVALRADLDRVREYLLR
jgi:peptide chain release factor subunit 1